MAQYGYLIAGIGMAVLLAIAIYLDRLSRSKRPGRSYSWASYLLLWPLVLDADSAKRKGKFLTTREWLGWAVVALVIVCGMLLSGSHA